MSETTAWESARLERTQRHLTRLMMEWVSRRSKVEAESVDPKLPLASQGLDSVSMVELVSYVEEQAGISVPDSAVCDDPTIDGLVACLAEAALAGPTPSEERPAERASRTAPSDIANPTGGVVFPDSPFR